MFKGISMSLVTDLLQGNIKQDEALDKIFKPLMMEAKNRTMVIELSLREGAKEGSKKPEDYAVTTAYYTEQLSVHRAAEKLKVSQLIDEHMMLIDKYNELLAEVEKLRKFKSLK
jgi:hypothetical protein